MKRLLRYLKPYKIEAVCAPLFKMFEAILELFVPLVMTAIIDNGIGNNDKGLIVKNGLLLVALGALGLLASVTAQFFAAKTAVGFAKGLKSDLFATIQHFTFSELDKVGNATLITRLTGDCDKVQNGVNMTLRLFLRSPFIVFGAMIMAFTINVKCALVFCVAIPVLSVIVFGIMLGTVPIYKRVQGAMDKSLVTSRENLGGVRVIRAFNLQTQEENRYREENDFYTRLQLKAGRISALLNPMTFVIVNIALAIILWTGSVKVNVGDITTGELVAIVNYMSQILVELVKLADLIILMTRSLASAKRIEEVFEIHEQG